jgi:ABC-type uncharacterized transport system permease subunit
MASVIETRLPPAEPKTSRAVSYALLRGSAILAAIGAASLLAFLPAAALVGKISFSVVRTFVIHSVAGSAGLTETLHLFVPIAFAGSSVWLCRRAGLYNLGAEGQLMAGALATAAAVDFVRSPGGFEQSSALSFLAILGIGLAAAAAGALVGLLVGLARAYLSMHEAVVTILLNLIVLAVVRGATAGPLRDPAGLGYPWTRPVPSTLKLPSIGVLGVEIPLAFLLAVSVLLVVALHLSRSRAGLVIRAVADNPQAAAFHGIDVRRVVASTLAVGGALAGLGGAAELLGHQFRLGPFFSPGFGFHGLVAAMIAGKSGAALPAAAFWIAVLLNGSAALERLEGIPASVSAVAQGIALIAIGGIFYRKQALQALPLRIPRPTRRPGPPSSSGSLVPEAADPGDTASKGGREVLSAAAEDRGHSAKSSVTEDVP